MTQTTLRLALAASLTSTGCQVTNGVLCSYLNDNCGDEAGDETGEPEAPPPPANACTLIGDATGLDLVEVHPLPVSAGVWMGLAAAALVFGPDVVGFKWRWLPGGQPGDTATLDSLESSLTIYTTTPNIDVAMFGYAYTEPVGGSANLVRAANGFSGDSSLEIEATALPLGAESTLWYAPVPVDGLAVPSRWDFTGGLRARGVVTSGGSTLAGPAGGNTRITEDGMPSRGFLPTMGWCTAAPPDVADDTGTPPDPDTGSEPEPEPEPDVPADPPGTFDPCVELGYGPTTVRPAGYSPTWVGESETSMVTLWIFPTQAWHWGPHELVEGLRSILGSWGTALVDEAPPGAAAAYVLVEDIVDPFTVPAMTRSTSTSVQDAEAVQLADNSWLVWVDEPGAGAATWYSGDTLPRLRGWARYGLPGVPATGGKPGVANTVGGNGWAFMPAAGYCVPEPGTVDESDG
jgi:hypothetical protein